jgi:hypothetical protein
VTDDPDEVVRLVLEFVRQQGAPGEPASAFV